MDCGVCCERFNRSNHAKVKCGFCHFPQCTSCAERYILDSSDDPHCMNCKTGWDTTKLVENFSQKFVTKDLKKRREDLLFERERALMPATQPLAERAKTIHNCNKEVERLSLVITHNIAKTLNYFNTITDRLEAYEIGMPTRRETAELELQRNYIQYKLSILLNNRRVEPTKKFIRCCPSNDCKGFLSTGWKCGLCGIKACAQCHEIKTDDDDHVCLPANLETARLLDKDTRPCPKCASMIFKIDGCDQMWCTQCQTTFSWRTGQVEVGRTHNPHFYEYLRRQNNGVIPREVGDNPHGPPPCNIHAYPDPYSINSFIGVFERNNPGYNIRRLGIIEILRALLHNVYIIRGWVPVQYTPQVNEELRIQYMINITPAEVYKKELQKREKDRNKKRDMTDILSMFETVSREIMHKIWRETIPRKIEEYVAELQTLREYANDNMKLVSKRYKCIYPHMNEQFIMVSSRA